MTCLAAARKLYLLGNETARTMMLLAISQLTGIQETVLSPLSYEAVSGFRTLGQALKSSHSSPSRRGQLHAAGLPGRSLAPKPRASTCSQLHTHSSESLLHVPPRTAQEPVPCSHSLLVDFAFLFLRIMICKGSSKSSWQCMLLKELHGLQVFWHQNKLTF